MKKRLFYITIALIALVVGLNLIARGESISGKVERFVIAKAREELGFDVGMDRLVVNFFPSYLDMYRPYIRGWDKSDPKKYVGAEKVRVYFGLAALLNKELRVRRVQVYNPSAQVVRLKGGGFNIDPLTSKIKALMEKKGGPPEYKVSVDEVAVFGARLTYKDPVQGVWVAVGNAGADFRLMGEDHYRLGFIVKDVVARRGGTPPFHILFEGDARYDKGAVKVEGVRLTAEGTKVGLSGDIRWAKSPVMDLDLDAKVDLRLLDRLGVIKDGPTGELDLKGNVKGEYPDLSGKGAFALKRLVYAGIEVSDISSAISFVKGELMLPALKARLLGGSVEGSASMNIGVKPITYKSSWRLSELNSGLLLDKDKALHVIPWQRVSGNIDINGQGLDASGMAASGALSVKLIEGAPTAGKSKELEIVKSVVVNFRLKDKMVYVDDGLVRSLATVVNFNGRMGLDGETEFAIKGHSSDIGEISTIIGYRDMKGFLDLTGYMKGKIYEPEIVGKATITEARAHGIAFQSGYGDVKLSGWVLSFRDFLINHDSGSFLVNGKIAFQGEGASFEYPYFEAKLAAREVRARKIIAIFYEDIPVNVSASGDITFSGTTRKFRGEAKLQTGAGDVYGQKIDRGEVSAVLTENEIAFPKVVVIKDRDIVTASGGIRFDGTFYGKASSARAALRNVEVLTRAGLPLAGNVSLSVSGQGSFDHPVIDANVKTFRLYVKDLDVGEAGVNARIKDGALTLGGDVMDGKAKVDALLELKAPYRWRGRLGFEGARAEPFVKVFYKQLPEGLTLVSTGTFAVDSSLDRPEEMRLKLNLSDLQASIEGRSLKNVGDISLSYADERLNIRSFKLTGEGMGFDVTGGSEGVRRVDLSVKAKLELDILKKYTEPTLDYISGQAAADLKVRGELSDPTVSGKVNIKEAAIKFRDFPQRIGGITGSLSLTNNEFTLERMKGELGGGSVSITGKGGFKGQTVENFAFTVAAQDVKVRYPENLLSTVDANLAFEGAGAQKVLSGEVAVTKARYSERIDWKSWLVSFEKSRKDYSSREPGAASDVALNIKVTGHDTIKIDNNVAKIPVSSDLIIGGTVGRPSILGRFESSGGQVYFRSNQFRLINGVVEFADPNKLDPMLDLQAETKVKEYTIQMSVSGTMERLKVTLLSDPPLPDVDIVALLTLGRTSEGLRGHESAITTGEAASFVTGQIQDAVEERVRRLTGFDRFQIDPYTTTSGTSTGPRLTVGKSLFGDKLYVTYSTNLGTSEDQIAKLEYAFSKNLSLVGERDEQGRVGGDIKFHFEFK